MKAKMVCLLMMVILMISGGVVSQAEPEAEVFHVRDFGVEPDCDTDAGPGIRAAIEAAKAAEGMAIVQFDSGAYRVAPEADQGDALTITDAQGLTIEGMGTATRIIVTDPTVGGIRFQRCRNVRIAHLAIDYDPVPFTQGTVIETDPDEGTFTMEIDDGYLPPGEPHFEKAHAKWGLVVRLEEPEQYGPVPIYMQSWTKLENGTWQGKAQDGTTMTHGGIRPGARFMYMARRHIGAAVTAWDSQEVELDHVTVYSSPSLATLWGLTEDITVRGLRVERAPDTDRLLSTNADGIHSLGNRGRLLIEDCYFTAMADDAINIHARAAVPIEQLSSSRFLINPAGTVEFREGDRVQIYDPEHGRIRYDERRIIQVEQQDNGLVRVDFNAPVENVFTGSSFHDADHFFNVDACGAGAVIRNNHFGNHRGRGILLKSTGCQIKGNLFQNREGWAIAMHQLQDWGEGPAAQDTLIRGNTFEGSKPGWSPFIDIRPSKRGNVPTDGRPVRSIHIEDNQMINPVNGVLNAWGVEGLRFTQNTIEADANTRVMPGALLTIDNAVDVHIADLIVRDANDTTNALIYIGPGTREGENGIYIGELDAELPPGVPVINNAN